MKLLCHAVHQKFIGLVTLLSNYFWNTLVYIRLPLSCFYNSFLLLDKGATLFSRNLISSNRRFSEIQFCRKSFDGIVTWPNRRISETSCRTTFFRIAVQPNVIFPNLCSANGIFTNRRSAERRFPETLFADERLSNDRHRRLATCVKDMHH